MDVAQLAPVARDLYGALFVMPCTCKRIFPYSGIGEKICRRCDALAKYELLTTGRSPTLEAFNARKI